MGVRPPFIAVLISAAAVGCGGGDSGSPTAPSSAMTIHLAGRVVDERTMQGVAGVTLLWGGAGIPPIPAGGPVPASLTTITDANGSYQAELPDAAYYSVSGGMARGIVRPIGALDIVNFYVNTGGCPTQYGRVVDAVTRRAIAGAQVSWTGLASTSDATGNYRLALACQPGSYGSGLTTFSVSHPSYQPYSTPARTGEALGSVASEERLDVALTPR
jgi:hypothetical protein